MVAYNHMDNEEMKTEFLSAVHRVCLKEAQKYINMDKADQLHNLFFHYANISQSGKKLYIYASSDGKVESSYAFGYIEGGMYFDGYLASSEIEHEKVFNKIRKDINILIGYEESEEEEEKRKELLTLGLNFEILG